MHLPSNTRPGGVSAATALAVALFVAACAGSRSSGAAGSTSTMPPRISVPPTGVSPSPPASPTPSPNPLPAHTQAPSNVRPILHPAAKGEGVWKPVGRKVAGLPTTLTTYVRPAPNVYARLIWMDPKLLQFRLYAGTGNPGGSGWRHRGMVPRSQRAELAATFNSGFMTYASHGGFYAYGRFAGGLVKGAASVVIFKDGTLTVGAWGSGQLRMGSNIAAVRQTLTLMINNGKVLPTVYRPYPDWGATLYPGAADWRTGIGVTATGAIVYAGGGNLTPVTLAKALLRAGCVRAMQLDINPEWPSFNVYTPASHGKLLVNPHKMLTDPMSATTRYIAAPDMRDFFAAFVRSTSG